MMEKISLLSKEEQEIVLQDLDMEQLQWDWNMWSRPNQVPPKDNSWDVGLFLGGRGVGKLLEINTPIRVYNSPTGWKRIGDIVAGDQVFDENGCLCTVTQAHDPEVPEKMYRLTFSDGTYLDAGGEHQWVTWTAADRKSFNRADGSRQKMFVDTTQGFPENWPTWTRHDRWGKSTGVGPKIRTTQDIVETFTTGLRGDTNHSIPVTKALALPENTGLLVDPYILGVWLGDGTSAGSEITQHRDDVSFLVGKLQAEGYNVSVKYKKFLYPNTATISPRGGLRRSLVAANVLNNKHIPREYLEGSIEQRTALLAGLLDTDGTINPANNIVEFCTVSPRLAGDFMELARSLGQKPKITQSASYLYGVIKQDRYRITWRATFNPFLYQRKREKYVPLKKQALRHYHRMITSFEEITPVLSRCLTVDSPNSMYLAGESLIPTHNTRAASEWVREKAKITSEGPLRFLLVARTAADVREVIVEGESGILAVSPPSERPDYRPSIRRLVWPNGNQAFCTSADEPDSLRGVQAPLSIDTPIATPSGFVPLKDISVGDAVYDEKGRPVHVTFLHPITSQDIYRVHFTDGSYIDSTGDHAWVAHTKADRGRMDRQYGKQVLAPDWGSWSSTFKRKDSATPQQQKIIYDMAQAGEPQSKISKAAGVSVDQVKNWRKKFRDGFVPGYLAPIVTTQELSSDHSIPAGGALQTAPSLLAPLPMDPWVLGLVLGDGATRQPGTIASSKEDIHDTIRRLVALGHPAKEKKNFKIAALNVSKLWGESKTVPEEYFQASQDDRLALVQGMTDSDGGVEKNGAYRFYNTNKNLIDAYVRLTRSLGLVPRVYCRKNRTRYGVPVLDSWCVQVYSSTPLVTLPRKLSKVPNKKCGRSRLERRVLRVEKIGVGSVRCVTVDSKNHLFLAGEGLVPTGNSYSWGDEIAAWRQPTTEGELSAWDNLRIATRLGRQPQIFATTTPKRVQILFDLLEEQKKNERIWVSRGSTFENAGNLSQAYLDAITGVYDGTSLARQELYGEMLDAVEGALWDDDIIKRGRVMGFPGLTPLRIIGVDPSVAENPGDECGIVVCASTGEHDLYKRNAWVLEDASIKGSPTVWAQAVVRMANKWGCPVVAEVNQGGALVRNAIHQIDPSVVVLEVHSKFGKKLRAEPVTLAYQQERVHHVGFLSDLETQMITWDPESSKKSPDRVDALVHALTALLINPPRGFTGSKVRAHSFADRRINTKSNTGLRSKLTGGGGASFRIR